MLLVERAQAAIANRDATQFVNFLHELDKADISLKDLGIFMRETRTRSSPNEPLIVSAARKSDRVIVEALVQRSVDVDEASSGGERAVHCAKDAECVRILVQGGAKVYGGFLSSGGIWESALSLAVKDRDLVRASVLIGAGAWTWTALVKDVIQRQDDDMFQCLLPRIYDWVLRVIRHFAVRFGTASMIHMLLERNRSFRYMYGPVYRDLLRVAAGYPNAILHTKAPYPDAVEKIWLLGLQDSLAKLVSKASQMRSREERGIDAEPQTSVELSTGAAPSHDGLRRHDHANGPCYHLEITIRMILVAQHDTSDLRRQDWRRHDRASLLSKLQEVKTQFGEADTLRKLGASWPPDGSRVGDLNAVKLVYGCLLEHGWNIHQKIDGLSLLHHLSSRDRTSMAKWLLDHGAAINELTDEQPRRTPLAIAAAADRSLGIEWLISQGARADGAGLRENEKRPLTAAVELRYSAGTVKRLLEAGARIYPEDDEPKIERVYRVFGGTRAVESFRAQHDNEVFTPPFAPSRPQSWAQIEELDRLLGESPYRDPGAPGPQSSLAGPDLYLSGSPTPTTPSCSDGRENEAPWEKSISATLIRAPIAQPSGFNVEQ